MIVIKGAVSHLTGIFEHLFNYLILLEQVVSEKLSHHIIQNYDKFVDGVNEVIHVEEDLQASQKSTTACDCGLRLDSYCCC